MICPNCGASNSTRATFCRRCRQRLPVDGLATGVTYRRRGPRGFYTSGGSRLPVYAAIILAATGFIVGAVLIGLARPPGPASSFIAGASSSPGSTLPIFVQPTPTPTAQPTPPPQTSFPGLPTPIPETPQPTDSPGLSPTPVGEPTPTPTATPPKTPRPTRSPTPTPRPTPTPAPVSCAAATGTPTSEVVIGFGNRTSRTSRGWCIDSVTFHIVTEPPGSTFGTVRLLQNGKNIADYTCSPPAPCLNDQGKTFAPPKLAKPGATLAYDFTCAGDETNPDACTTPGFNATITIRYEIATSP